MLENVHYDAVQKSANRVLVDLEKIKASKCFISQRIGVDTAEI